MLDGWGQDLVTRIAHVLVTGATGGLGRALINGLVRRQHRVLGIAAHAPANGQSGCEDLIVADIAQVNWDEVLAGCETLFHLASYVHKPIRTESDRAAAWRTNVEATVRLAEACRRHGTLLVFASSVAALQCGPGEQQAPSHYAKTKWSAEREIESKADLRFVILRFPLLYGPAGRGNMERLLRAIHRRRYWPIGAGTAKKSCLFFDDAAEALVQASGSRGALGGTFVVAPPAPVTLGEIHSCAFAAFGRSPPPAIPLPLVTTVTRLVDAASPYLFGHPTSLTESARTLAADAAFDGSAFAQVCGFTPRVDLKTGLKATADWIRGNA
jgi:UDP-glucose 4-epimerase